MSSEAIMSICLATTICVIVICMCVNSCISSHYQSEQSFDYNTYGGNNWYTSTDCVTTYTFKEDATDEEKLKVLQTMLDNLKDGCIYSLKVDNVPINTDELTEFLKTYRKESE